MMIKSADAAAGEAARQQLVVQRCLAKIKNRAMDGALVAWIGVVDHNKTTRVLLKRAAMKMQRRLVVASMNSWVDYYEARLRARYLCGKVFGKLAAGTIGAAFVSWVDMVKFQNMKANEEGRKQLIVQRCLAKIKHRRMGSAYVAWVSIGDLKREQRVLLSRAAKKLKERHIAKSFASWGWFCQDRQQHRQLVDNIVTRFTLARTSVGLRTWIDFTRATTDALNKRAAVAEHKRKGVHRAIMRIKFRTVSVSIESWRQWATERRRLHLRMRTIAQKMISRRQMAAFHGWTDVVIYRRRNKACVTQSLLRLQHRAAAAAYATWVDFRRRRQHHRRLWHVALRQLATGTKRAVFANWRVWNPEVVVKPALCARCGRKCDRCRFLDQDLKVKDGWTVSAAIDSLHQFDTKEDLAANQAHRFDKTELLPRVSAVHEVVAHRSPLRTDKRSAVGLKVLRPTSTTSRPGSVPFARPTRPRKSKAQNQKQKQQPSRMYSPRMRVQRPKLAGNASPIVVRAATAGHGGGRRRSAGAHEKYAKRILPNSPQGPTSARSVRGEIGRPRCTSMPSHSLHLVDAHAKQPPAPGTPYAKRGSRASPPRVGAFFAAAPTQSKRTAWTWAPSITVTDGPTPMTPELSSELFRREYEAKVAKEFDSVPATGESSTEELSTGESRRDSQDGDSEDERSTGGRGGGGMGSMGSMGSCRSRATCIAQTRPLTTTTVMILL